MGRSGLGSSFTSFADPPLRLAPLLFVFGSYNSRTERHAQLDSGGDSFARFARASFDRAKSSGHDTIFWHFPAKQTLEVLEQSPLKQTASRLKKVGAVEAEGMTIVFVTRRMNTVYIPDDAPVAAWFTDDDDLFKLESGLRPCLDVLLSRASRAPIWLTAFGLDVGEPVGVDAATTNLMGLPRVWLTPEV